MGSRTIQGVNEMNEPYPKKELFLGTGEDESLRVVKTTSLNDHPSPSLPCQPPTSHLDFVHIAGSENPMPFKYK